MQETPSAVPAEDVIKELQSAIADLHLKVAMLSARNRHLEGVVSDLNYTTSATRELDSGSPSGP